MKKVLNPSIQHIIQRKRKNIIKEILRLVKCIIIVLISYFLFIKKYNDIVALLPNISNVVWIILLIIGYYVSSQMIDSIIGIIRSISIIIKAKKFNDEKKNFTFSFKKYRDGCYYISEYGEQNNLIKSQLVLDKDMVFNYRLKNN